VNTFTGERARRLAVRPDHRAYLEQLEAVGKVIAAGLWLPPPYGPLTAHALGDVRWSDDSGALIVYDAL
jgi:uncharacterized protein YciI